MSGDVDNNNTIPCRFCGGDFSLVVLELLSDLLGGGGISCIVISLGITVVSGAVS